MSTKKIINRLSNVLSNMNNLLFVEGQFKLTPDKTDPEWTIVQLTIPTVDGIEHRSLLKFNLSKKVMDQGTDFGFIATNLIYPLNIGAFYSNLAEFMWLVCRH